MAPSTKSDSLQAGQLFGRYLVVDRVGAGGVGEVYAAYDPSLDRRIALKVIRAGDDDEASSQGAAGLVREAKALASLSHPNVVTVHEVGQEEDRVYVAMELVDGRDLEQWIEENTERPWRATLDVFIDAGRGLAAAHARGILHRDFKPANVLIGHDDWVRVSDFGLAMLLSGDDSLMVSRSEDERSLQSMDASQTLEGGMVGTPYYMAPEQIDGNATVQSDVYAFCLALHDALYGERAFVADSFLELATLKSTKPPTDLDSVRGVPSIVRSAIERGLLPDPEDRWPSMDALLEQLEHALKPAARSTLPWVLGLGGIAAGAAMLAQDTTQPCSGATDALGSAWSADRRSAVTQGIAESESPIAPETSSRVAPQLDAFVDTWTQTHTRVCEATQRGEQSPALLDQRMTCLQRQLLEFRAAVDVLEHADVQVVRRAIRVVGALPEPAWCESQEADPDAQENSPALDEAREERAHVNALLTAGKYDEAQARSGPLLESARELGAPRFLGEVLYTHGNALYESGNLNEAVDTLEQAAFQGVGSNAPRVVLRAANVLTVVESEAGHPDDGLRWSRLSAAMLIAAGDRRADRAVHHANRATAFSQKGDYASGETEIRKALEFSDSVSEQQRVTLLQTLGGVLFYLSRIDEAVELQAQALEELEATLGPDHPAVGLALFNLGTFQMSQGKFSEGDAYLERALALQERSLGPDHTDVGDTLNSLGASAYQQGNIPEALKSLERALEIKRRELSPTHRQVLEAEINVALLISATGDLERSGTMLEEVLDLAEENEDTPGSTKSSALINLGVVRNQQERLDEASSLYERALVLDEERVGSDDPRLATTLRGLGVVRKKQGRFDEALVLYQRALDLQEGQLEPNHPGILATLINLGNAQVAAGKPAKAKATAERLLSVSEGREDYIGRAKYLLAQSHRAMGERSQARSTGREAVALHRTVPGLKDELADVESFMKDLD